MATNIKTFTVRPNGAVVAVLADGRIVEQVPRPDNRSGVYDTTWQDIPTEGIVGRVVQIGARFDGRLIVLNAAGQLFAQGRQPYDPPGYKWAAIEPPEPEPGP